MLRRGSSIAWSTLGACVVLAAACSGKGSDDSNRANDTPNDAGAADAAGDLGTMPFAPDPPSVYVGKVKNVLVGLAPTDAEVQAVVADPNALGGLVDQWMKLPQYEAKMLRFFELAFEQTQITALDFVDMLDQGQLQLDQNKSTSALMLQNLQESFARTALALNDAGKPFNTTMTTHTHALTTALKVFYALLDVWQIDDNMNGLHDYFAQANPSLTITVTSDGPIPLAQTLDPSNANYMHWYDPGVASLGGPAGCAGTSVTVPARANTLYDVLLGVLPGKKLADGTQCPGGSGTGQLTAADFSDWTMTDIEPPSGGKATAFYDLQTLRGGTKMSLKRPYVGFFSTPAFFANWQTNQSNQMRVTANQTLIVATGAQVDGVDSTMPSSTPGLDPTHANLADCLHCHQLLDPTRSIFSATFSWNYGMQLDPTWTAQKGRFVFEGVDVPVASIDDLAKTLATHPLLPSAWAQKLCYWVDSEACVADDPELQRIVQLFTTSSLSWNALVKAVVTSPITTHATATKTATTNGEVVAVARRDHWCAAMNARLGLADFCGLDALTSNDVAPASSLAIVSGLPSDGYGRGSVAPVMPNQPSLFFRAGTENLCEALAAIVIDNAKPPTGAKTWSSAQPDAAIADFVGIVMGVPPSDARAAQLTSLLKAHFDTAKAQSTATAALQSTFTVACLAPSAVSMGM